MGRIFFISGIGLIALSSILYTAERFMAVFFYVGDSLPVKLTGDGSYIGEPIMPHLFDNPMVGILFIMGIPLLLLGIVGMLKMKQKSVKKQS